MLMLGHLLMLLPLVVLVVVVLVGGGVRGGVGVEVVQVDLHENRRASQRQRGRCTLSPTSMRRMILSSSFVFVTLALAIDLLASFRPCFPFTLGRRMKNTLVLSPPHPTPPSLGGDPWSTRRQSLLPLLPLHLLPLLPLLHPLQEEQEEQEEEEQEGQEEGGGEEGGVGVIERGQGQ
jgi:hypothetical protein